MSYHRRCIPLTLKFYQRDTARFLAVVTFLVQLLLGCAGLMRIRCPTFLKLQFEFDPFLRVSSACTTWVSLMPRWMLGSSSMFKSDFLRMSRIGRHSRKIDSSFISPKLFWWKKNYNQGFLKFNWIFWPNEIYQRPFILVKVDLYLFLVKRHKWRLYKYPWLKSCKQYFEKLITRF